MNNLRVKKVKKIAKITIASKMKNPLGKYIVKLVIMDDNQTDYKEYYYEFEGEEQWNQYYYSYSYKSHPTSMSRTIKFTLLKAIEQFLIK